MAYVKKGHWTKEQMQVFIDTNDQVLYRALLALYDCQTSDEQESQATRHINYAGFNGLDASFLSSISESLKRYGRLTDKQKLATRKTLKKYMGQITNLANEQYAMGH